MNEVPEWVREQVISQRELDRAKEAHREAQKRLDEAGGRYRKAQEAERVWREMMFARFEGAVAKGSE